jgi:hypothetical protein
MRRSRFSEGRDNCDIARSGGRKLDKDVCAAHNVSTATYHA